MNLEISVWLRDDVIFKERLWKIGGLTVFSFFPCLFFHLFKGIFALEIYNEDEYDSIWKCSAKLTQCTGANGETKYFPNIDLESLKFESLTPLRPIFL